MCPNLVHYSLTDTDIFAIKCYKNGASYFIYHECFPRIDAQSGISGLNGTQFKVLIDKN